MLKIQKTSNGQVVITLSGRFDEDHIAELTMLVDSEPKGRRVVLDLKDLTLAGHEVVAFLARCEMAGVTLLHCAPYVREWITRLRAES